MRVSLIDLTDGYLTDWSKEGGSFKEWIRGIEMNATNHGYFYALRMEPYYFYRNVLRVLSWIPFLWADRDWDHVYLWRIMRYKIERMRRDQETGQNHTDWKKVADQMRVAELVLSRLIDDDYVTQEWEEHTRKYGTMWDRREELPNGGSVCHPHPDPNSGLDVRRIANLEESRRRFDMEYLGQYLTKHCRSWWS